MELHFSKYHGAGNDFIIIDDREDKWSSKLTRDIIRTLCSRNIGIGGDGLILLRNLDAVDFEMVYYNSDGNKSSMCGNGARCIVAFAKQIELISKDCIFKTIDGLHTGEILSSDIVKISMSDVNSIDRLGEKIFELDTGSPHYVKYIDNWEVNKSIVNEAQEIRFSEIYKENGINVNFVKKLGVNLLKIRTYERGVEDETLACGTGVTAAALADAVYEDNIGHITKEIIAVGGELKVEFEKNKNSFSNIFLTGPVKHVFDGTINVYEL